MMFARLFFVLALVPASALCADLDKSGQETQSSPQPAVAAGQDAIIGAAENPVMPDLQRIDSFKVQMEKAWQSEGATKDESTSLVVNPFTVRKRGKTYGSVYEYHRNDNFDARNFFDPLGKPLPEFKRNQFGISLGASITSKLNVFGSFDGLRIVKGSTFLSVVPTAAMKRGDFSAITWQQLVDPFTGAPIKDNKILPSSFNPVSAKLLSLFPDPNRNDDPVLNYVNNQPFINNNNSISSRVDYEFGPKTKIFGKYYISDSSQGLVSSLPSFGTTLNERDQDVSIDLTHSFNPSKVLNIHLGFYRSSSLQLSKLAHQHGLLESLGIEGVHTLDDMDEGYPQFDIIGFANLGFGNGMGFPGNGIAGGSPENWGRNYFNIKSDYAYIHGNHNIGISANLDIVHLNNMRTSGTRRGQFGFSGQFTGNAFADFLMGIPYTATRGIGSNRSDLRQRSWRLGAKDDWKINRNFTLSVSLAYSFSPFFRSTRDNVSFVYPLVFEPRNSEVVVTGSSRARELGLGLNSGQAAYNDKNDWEPSLGIAYSPLGNNRLVLRASYSIQHSSMTSIQGLIYVGRNYPFFYLQTAQSPTQPELNLSRPFTSIVAPAMTFQAVDPYLRNPYVQKRTVSLQYEFLHGWNLELTYNGSKDTRVFRAIPSNVPLPGRFDQPIQPRRPNPAFGEIDVLSSNASYSINGLNAQVKHSLTGAFSLQATFMWNRAVSDCWGWGFVNPNNPRNLKAERSLWGFDPSKTFSLDYILDLPVGREKLLSTRWAGKFAQVFEGWRISGITRILGGWPYNPEIFGDPNNDGVWGDRPNRIGPGTLPKSKRTVNKWFETNDFVMPDLNGTNPQWFGNSGRNVLLTPGFISWDISLLKRTRVTKDGSMLEFRVQFFNAFNNVNFQQPGSFMNTPTFGVISGAENAREIEIALKYTF
jgi:hypothetical protein